MRSKKLYGDEKHELAKAFLADIERVFEKYQLELEHYETSYDMGYRVVKRDYGDGYSILYAYPKF